ncbi:MAG: hypothetical protein HC836_35665 [Richelia sp. RM2_1_2]|nr:hypothetical protein [Richelia sp. RM2_1_2]
MGYDYKSEKWEISPDTALERRLEDMKHYKSTDWKLDDDAVAALRTLYKKSWGLHQILNLWPNSLVMEFVDSDPKDYFMDGLDRIPRYWFEGCIPTYWNDAHNKTDDFIMVYDFMVETDGYNCQTGWTYIWFAVFDHEEITHDDGHTSIQHNKVAFAGKLKVGTDIFDATADEIRQWKYARDFEWTQMTYDDLVTDMKKRGRINE